MGKIADILTVGQWVAVQVAKEPISTKGPRLTSELSIAGRNLVLMPFADKVSVSQKISGRTEKTETFDRKYQTEELWRDRPDCRRRKESSCFR